MPPTAESTTAESTTAESPTRRTPTRSGGSTVRRDGSTRQTLQAQPPDTVDPPHESLGPAAHRWRIPARHAGACRTSGSTARSDRPSEQAAVRRTADQPPARSSGSTGRPGGSIGRLVDPSGRVVDPSDGAGDPSGTAGVHRAVRGPTGRSTEGPLGGPSGGPPGGPSGAHRAVHRAVWEARRSTRWIRRTVNWIQPHMTGRFRPDTPGRVAPVDPPCPAEPSGRAGSGRPPCVSPCPRPRAAGCGPGTARHRPRHVTRPARARGRPPRCPPRR